VRGGTRFLALVAPDAEIFVDDENTRRFAQSVRHEIPEYVTRLGTGLHECLAGQLLRGVLLQSRKQSGLLRNEAAQIAMIDAERLGCHRSMCTYGADRVSFEATSSIQIAPSGAIRQHRTVL
jgi:hypothetical protein